MGPVRAADTPAVPRFTDPERRAKLERAFPEVERAFREFLEERKVPGLVFGVVIDGDLALVKAMGIRDRSSNDPVTPDTVFRIASMTKSFTALAILKLRDEGKLSLDDPVTKWIPELLRLRYPTTDSPSITIRHLLTHGAGFPEDNPWGDRQLSRSDDTMSEWLRQGIPFSTPPGTAYEYSNYGFALLGRIVARVTGLPYREYVEKRILAPLGMTASSFEPSDVPEGVRATGYGRTGDAYFEVPPLPHGSFGSMGGLLTSARDLGRYVAFHLSAWPPRDDEDRGPMRRSSVREMHMPWRDSGFFAGQVRGPTTAQATGYGYGLRIQRDCRFGQIVGHGGGLPGFGSYMAWLPEYGVGIFAMTNLTYAGPSSAIDRAFDILLSTRALKPRDLPPSPALLSTRDALLGLWEKWDETAADAIAADNLFQDAPAAARRRQVEQLKEWLGACRQSGELQPENLLRGKFRLTCDKGFVDVRFTLAPTRPPRVQQLVFDGTRTPEPDVAERISTFAGLFASFDDSKLESLLPAGSDARRFRERLEMLRPVYGDCRMGETLGGDGRRMVSVLFDCRGGGISAHFRFDEDGKMTNASFSRAPGAACGP